MSTINQTLRYESFAIGDFYTRNTVADTGKVPRPNQPRDWTGIVPFSNCVLLFVTLNKESFKKENQYYDIFNDDGKLFYWDSQNNNTPKTPSIARIISGTPVILFARVDAKQNGKSQPFVYVGPLNYIEHESEKPVHFLFMNLQHSFIDHRNLQSLYTWFPAKRTKSLPKLIQKAKTAKYGQGRLIDPKKKKAIELHAMAIAKAHYETSGFAVEDTSSFAPYDFKCSRGNEIRLVEVKGTQGEPSSVNVTFNEVESARNNSSTTDLFIVHGIEIVQVESDYKASGGKVEKIDDWFPEDQHLKPTAYTYFIPTE
ncbi:DUF3427 domain-containing protein [Photobacterium sp. GSS17]|uniref:DUF3427 domain-containing protein n=1 Tax=Photobacterium sp. GSS17 TaxID=3020715 RepID=UPI002361BC81|nr:DUF3427 domain-containing protein [Photobacterium sp. GSS17]